MRLKISRIEMGFPVSVEFPVNNVTFPNRRIGNEWVDGGSDSVVVSLSVGENGAEIIPFLQNFFGGKFGDYDFESANGQKLKFNSMYIYRMDTTRDINSDNIDVQFELKFAKMEYENEVRN